jgi:hypothetical protein
MKMTALILGFFTIRMGFQLVRQGASGDFKFNLGFGGFKADLASLSPGLLFVLLGVGLIGYSVYVKKPVDLDTPTQQQGGPPDVSIPKN